MPGHVKSGKSRPSAGANVCRGRSGRIYTIGTMGIVGNAPCAHGVKRQEGPSEYDGDGDGIGNTPCAQVVYRQEGQGEYIYYFEVKYEYMKGIV